MVEEDSRAGEHTVALAVILGYPVTVQLRYAVGTSRVEGGSLLLRNLLHETEHLGGRSLIEAALGLNCADSLEHICNAYSVDVGGAEGSVPARRNEGLCGEVVYLVSL